MNVEQCNLIQGKWINHNKTVVEVAKYLRDNKMRRVYIVDDAMAPVGIVSTSDISNHIVAEGKDPKTLKAKDVMTKGILIVDSADQVPSVAIEMDKYHVPSVAVAKDKKMVGELTVEECTKTCLNIITQKGGMKK